VPPLPKATNHASDAEPANGDADQNESEGAPGNAVKSIIGGVVCE